MEYLRKIKKHRLYQRGMDEQVYMMQSVEFGEHQKRR